MDLKLLLRYQISGSVFIGWFLLFHYSVHSADWADMAKHIMDVTTLLTFIASIPIGAIIHQISVTIKNQIFGLCEDSYLSDSPMKKPTQNILEKYEKGCGGEFVKYIDEKISRLNSFYYMRFDNGFLAPFISFILFLFIDNDSVKLKINLLFILGALSCLLLFITLVCIRFNKYKKMCYFFILGVTTFLLIPGNLISIIVSGHYLNVANNSNVEITTKSVQVESNTRYIITNQYSFESSESMRRESQIFADNVIDSRNLSKILQVDDLQKISIIESKEDKTSNQTFTCTSKCTKCSKELSCSLSYDKDNQIESQLHISNAEITKIDTSLLNKILMACLVISFLLLSYIPRIIKELEEYTKELENPVESSNKDNETDCKCLQYIKNLCEKICNKGKNKNGNKKEKN